jgi:hypothetical protein
MLTALDIINRLLNYFNIQDKPKGKAFTVVAFIANFYILYVAIDHLRYTGYRLKGVLYLLLFIVFLYFIFLNYVYYFTKRRFKYDISPRVEKLLGGSAKARTEAEKAYMQPDVNGNGVFDTNQVLPAKLHIDANQKVAIENLVTDLQKQGVLTLNYHGLNDEALTTVTRKTAAPVLAMGAPLPLPFFELQKTLDDRWVINGGINPLNSAELATVEAVGLTPIDQAAEQYQLAAAQVVLTGGPQKHPGRKGLMETTEPFSIDARIAFTESV